MNGEECFKHSYPEQQHTMKMNRGITGYGSWPPQEGKHYNIGIHT